MERFQAARSFDLVREPEGFLCADPLKMKQRFDEPLLTKFGSRPESPPCVPSRLSGHPRLGYTDGNTLAIRRRA
jgi:hypothetical protein